MSISDFLSGLDIEQLRFARDKADELIKKIESQDKVALFLVSADCVNIACYREHQFDSAKEKLCSVIMSDAFTSSFMEVDHPRIDKIKVYEREVDDWMKMNC